MKKQVGFTIIELMIVVTIIGVIASLAIPFLTGNAARAQVSEALSIGGGFKLPIAEAIRDNGLSIGCKAPSGATLSGKWVEGVTVSINAPLCVIEMRFVTTNIEEGVAGKTVTYTYNSDTAEWKCLTNLDPKVTPAGCK